MSKSNLPKIVVIEGNIGAGKTTLIDHLSKTLREKGKKVKVFTEAVEEWSPFLDHWYKNMNSESLSLLQFVIFGHFVKIYMKLYKEVEQLDVDYIIIERSIFTSVHVFLKSNEDILTQEHYNSLKNLFDIGFDLFNMLSKRTCIHCIYIEVGVEECNRRMKSRGREEESTVPIEYLRQIERAYKEMIEDEEFQLNFDSVRSIENKKDGIDECIEAILEI